jgi:Tol biopolymer transport system component
MIGAKHKVNHIMISPNGTKFMFMHRWLSKSGKRYDRLLVSNYDGTELKIISDNEMVSHCCWQDEDTIIGFLRNNNKDGFYKINLNRNEIYELSAELNALGDGHPTIINNKMVFDTYPDRSRMKFLYVYDFDKNKMNVVAEFFESLNYYNETRCDLHPRFNKDNSVIYVDSVHSGKRKLFKIELS